MGREEVEQRIRECCTDGDYRAAATLIEFRCSCRTWAYVLARHAELRFRSEPQRRPDRNLPFAGQLEEVQEGLLPRTSAGSAERASLVSLE